jgi:sulfur relay (sulfurtransferase) DsrC/TusE family protein
MHATIWLRSMIPAVAIAALMLSVPSASRALADRKEKKLPVPPMKEWEQDVRKLIAKDEKLKALAAKYPLVILHSRQFYARGPYKESAYSFIRETSNPEKHENRVQLVFHNGGYEKSLTTNLSLHQQNLVVDLGKEDFEKNPDLTRITIDHPGLADGVISVTEGHVYLERVRDKLERAQDKLERGPDKDGNNFYVLFQVVALDVDGRYIAFLWRRLPGGKVLDRQPCVEEGEAAVVPPFANPADQEKPEPKMKEWHDQIRKRMANDGKLKRLADKYSLVLLHSRYLYARGDYKRSAYSFTHETSDPDKHQGDAQLLFHNGGYHWSFTTATAINQENLVVDLGMPDFEKNPELGRINIDHPNLARDMMAASEGHVYLERVRDKLASDLQKTGNNFYVVFQVVALDPDSRYIAFIWRKIPGGKVVK